LLKDVERYGNHLLEIMKDMETRFHDIIAMKIESWMTDPFQVNISNVEIELQ